ncbi:HAMP domain-containing histidine kinase [Streptomyces albulus]|uniref:sensor histidine kinase n=1 Tax=Streptomyces noursei TaxID=1971 RepID=UPI001F281ED7|nr:HAMP domain-containing sensor histidine kinase [Streptomyces noursei]MCE4942690.1 HAMP domain-containing histidine kinase [Streptomyces noursei]
MKRPALIKRLSFGLRGRLIAGYLLVAAVSVVATAGFTYYQAHISILRTGQDTLLNSLRGATTTFADDLPYPPTRAQLTSFAGKVASGSGFRIITVSYGTQSVTSAQGGPTIPETLRRDVTANRELTFQRVTQDGAPWLTAGTPITFAGSGQPSGIVVYGATPLRFLDDAKAAVWVAAQYGAIPALVLAVPPALLAARGVLRPVRRLQHGARRMADGDLTSRIKVTGNDELADLTKAFNESTATLETTVGELRRMEAAARRFASDVSHELRTPVATMVAVSDVLDDSADTLRPDMSRAARLVTTEADRLARLVDDLMEISRFDAGANTLIARDIDVAEAVRACLRARGWQDEVSTDLPEPPVTARLDPRRLDVVMANLVGNALRHGAPPVTVRVTASEGNEDRVRISVTDHGGGLPPEATAHLFDRFFKADQARSRSEGSGLGLAIAWENTRLHGGTLTAANGPHGGAVFTAEFPRTPTTGEGT